jgi:DNA repair exonuclease SbcCD ATPase subunit
MTSSRYIIARVAQAFGYFRRNLRMADAASEMHLLREAEAQLGAAIWEKVEGIEELSVEYWNLRKLIKEKEIVRQKLVDCQARLDQAHEERVNVLISAPEINQELLDQRIELLMELEKLAQRRDEIVIEAREVRRIYDGMKMKLEVLTKESSTTVNHQQEIEKAKARLAELKSRFSDLKQQRVQIAQEIETGDAKVDLVDEQINEKKKHRRVHASEAFQMIGDGNKEISLLRAESALLDTQMRQLYAEIGRFVSRHTHQHAACNAAVATHRGLVDVMRALRRSIALNHRLAGTA